MHDMELSPSAKRVFKGVRYEVWQWEQELYDGSKAIFERIKRPDSVNIIASVDDAVIVQRQEQPGWFMPMLTLPGGVVDPGESPLEAAKRELLEESGYASDTWVLWKSASPSLTIVFTEYIFIAKNCKKAGEPRLDAGEKIETILSSLDDFLLLSQDDQFREHEVAHELLRTRLDSRRTAEFKKLLFSKS